MRGSPRYHMLRMSSRLLTFISLLQKYKTLVINAIQSIGDELKYFARQNKQLAHIIVLIREIWTFRHRVSQDSLLIRGVFNHFTPDRTKSKIDTFSKITNWVQLKNKQHYSKVLLNSFAMIWHFGVLSMDSKLENFVSPKG